MWTKIAGILLRNRVAFITGGMIITVFFGLQIPKVEMSYEYSNLLPATDSAFLDYVEFHEKFGQEGRDSDMLYQALLSCDGVEAAVFVRQETEHSCTAGFRSRDNIDVSVIASHFGGGGHKNASGMSCDGKLENLIPEIIKEFSKVLK